MNQPELFNLTPEQKKLAAEKNPMARTYGYFDGETKCKKCRFLCYKERTKRYYKCEKRGITAGEGTDHRVNWLSCKLYEEIKCETCNDDGVIYSDFDFRRMRRVYENCPDCQGGRQITVVKTFRILDQWGENFFEMSDGTYRYSSPDQKKVFENFDQFQSDYERSFKKKLSYEEIK